MFSFFAKKSFDQRPCYFWLLCHETPKKVFCYKLLKRMKSCYVHTTFKIHLLCHERHSMLTSHNVTFEFAYFLTTVCIFQDFSVTQILREIKIGESRVSNSAILTIKETLNLEFHSFVHFLKMKLNKLTKFRASKNGKNGNFRNFGFSKIDFT